jgi:hypothetical protein
MPHAGFCIKLKNLNTQNVILSVVLYGYENWSLTLKEDYNVRAIENNIMELVGRKRDDVTGSWKKIHKKGLCNLYSSPSIITYYT